MSGSSGRGVSSLNSPQEEVVAVSSSREDASPTQSDIDIGERRISLVSVMQ